MGVPDTVTYEYMKRNEVFADAFNFLLYNGEKIIDHSIERHFIHTCISQINHII